MLPHFVHSRLTAMCCVVSLLVAGPTARGDESVVARPALPLDLSETGLFASGRVEISGDGIAEGTLVGVPG